MKLPELFKEIIDQDNMIKDLMKDKVFPFEGHARLMVLKKRRQELTDAAEKYVQSQRKGD